MSIFDTEPTRTNDRDAFDYAKCEPCNKWWRQPIRVRDEFRPALPGYEYLGDHVHAYRIAVLGDWEESPAAGSSYGLWMKGNKKCPDCIAADAQLELFAA
jgi:hypothetical protein